MVKIELPGANRSLYAAFAEGAARAPATVLTVSSATHGCALTLGEVLRRGEQAGAHLRRLGVRPGDRIAVQLPAWAEWMIVVAAIAHAGAVLVPVVSIYGAKELSYILRHSRAKMLVTPGRSRKVDHVAVLAQCGTLPDLEHHVVIDAAGTGTLSWSELETPIDTVAAAPVAPDDLAVQVYTSGTTADPKGVRHSGRSILAELATQGLTFGQRVDVAFSPMPPGHVAGVLAMMQYMADSRPLVLMDQWDTAEAAMLIELHRVSFCALTPFHLTGVLDAADRDARDLSSLTDIVLGATPVPSALIERCAGRGMRPYRSYGSSEMPSVTMGRPDDPLEKRLTTEGRPMPGAEIRFVDDEGNDVVEGELAVRGPELFLGYADEALNQNAFLPGGWFLTGDIGRFDPDGFLRITDRKKDVIIRGGENIASREVEEVLASHPAIREAAVVAAPDARMGEVVCAFVIAQPGAKVTLESIGAHFAAAGIARQKTPERIVLVEDFPRNSTGKIMKNELRDQVRTMAAAEKV